ncbi:glucoamylase family protein [Fundicoccus culcitae]|uniref:Glycoamylase-like domain-containing protein n=1 Tax=Fundicoccus culcitae TaxID=2969821 RepID=A0ABY5P8B6_9LACT|nr:glucoamylase family protein [Fundicoccus culcitae]UUX34986.1 hypothetical protein NRE15_04895 [Fundicoccus culcitae]
MTKTVEEILQLEARASFDYLWKEANSDPDSPGYGLVRDGSGKKNRQMASIAAVGFALSGIPIAVERGWISKAEGLERAEGTLATFLNHAEHYQGFFYHFLNIDTAEKNQPFYDCPSIIDTSLFLNGGIVVATFFGGKCAEYFDQIYQRIDWTVYYDEPANMFYMGIQEDKGGFGHWGNYAEQLMTYILGVASPTHPVPVEIYDGFDRLQAEYGEYQFISAVNNPLFTHQFSHAWFNFQGVLDKNGVDWFDNSVQASLAQYQYAVDNPNGFKTYSDVSWGWTACDGPNGYRAYGAPPYVTGHEIEFFNDGTIAPCAAIGSLVFTPEESKKAVEYFYHDVPGLWGTYGFLDAYNWEQDELWMASRDIGIDKGISLLMIENYHTGLVWDLYMQHPIVQRGAELLGFVKK